ncbi:hypothetical protein H0H81_008362 [Sphagnurus paluster]|uniref:Uncharacterized protein n=1 Tax=Sphagnurus paluster TaxID=117069 RepID=A0A9P7FW35_9AGAR|nr:hypothetical protein H0H81_008362 [Sphagnurus paluster]
MSASRQIEPSLIAVTINLDNMSSQDPNYADFFGIHSVAAAIIFAVAYVPLVGWFTIQSFGRPTYVFIILTLFCAIRIAGFIIRAILAASDSVGSNLGVLIAEQVLFGVGFFGLLYSAYTLVLDRWSLTATAPGNDPLSRITHNRRIFRITLIIAVVLTTVGISVAMSNQHIGDALKVAGTLIFLVLTVSVAYQTVLLSGIELRGNDYNSRAKINSLGQQYGAYILCMIAALLIVREAFSTVTVFDHAKQYNERLWYPLYALPELLAVILYTTPGLVPPQSELPA